jgi:hypothetical protein
MDLHHRVNKMDLHPPIKKYMGLLSNIVKDSVNKVTRGQYDGIFGEGYSTQHAKSCVLPKFSFFPVWFKELAVKYTFLKLHRSES